MTPIPGIGDATGSSSHARHVIDRGRTGNNNLNNVNRDFFHHSDRKHHEATINSCISPAPDAEGDDRPQTSAGLSSSNPLKTNLPEPVAIIGLSCRFSGDATTPEELLKLVLEGRSAAGPLPEEKLWAQSYYHPNPDHGGTFCVKKGYFLAESADAFDAPFFNLSENDVAAMDPQQKLLLEAVYHGLENAGLSLKDVAGSQTSVFVGCTSNDHLALLNTDLELVLKNKGTGTSLSILANRVSWFYNLKGTSQTIDSACSSSLVAFHQACQSIRSGEASMAIVGGVNLIEHPGAFLFLSTLGILSPDGQCFSFDQRANGYGRGEGVSTVILKPLSTAMRDGNVIRAVVRASGSNQDGRTPGITVPNASAQASLIREIYSKANLDMRKTVFLEAHGTATQLGDPLEVSAISSAFQAKDRDTPLYISSVKASIGHLEGGAGLAGLVTATLMIENRTVPPNANLQVVNPQIPRDANIEFPKKAISWPKEQLFRASVNSFGFGGTNAHVILDDSHRHLWENTRLLNGVRNYSRGPKRKRLFIFTAYDEQGIKRVTQSLKSHFQSTSKYSREEQYLANLAFTLNTKRSLFGWRSYCVADSVDQLSRQLEFGLPKPTRVTKRGAIAFAFTGQGAQWPKMGWSLMIYPVFKQNLEQASTYFEGLGSPWRLMDVLSNKSSHVDINHPEFAQPACTAIQVALVELLKTWNILPDKVVGHSSGEIAAAFCAGRISRQAAWRIAFFRGIVSAKQLQNDGAMMAVALTEDELQPYFEKAEKALRGNIRVGCFNSPRSLTLTGKSSSLLFIKKLLDEEQKFARLLNVQVAYHSQYMEEVADEYRDLLHHSSYGDKIDRNHVVEMVSSVTAKIIVEGQVENPNYWVRNLVSPVQFSKAFATLFSGDKIPRESATMTQFSEMIENVIEIGPHSALQSIIKEISLEHIHARKIEYFNILKRNEEDATSILQTVGRLVCNGISVTMSSINPSAEEPRMLTNLPSYPFDHSRLSRATSRLIQNVRFPEFPRHEMLGAPVLDWNPAEPRWRNFIRTSETPWLRDNKMNGVITFPGVGYIVMAVEAVIQHAKHQTPMAGIRLRNIVMKAGLTIPDNKDGIEIMLSMRPIGDWQEFSVSTYDAARGTWTEHCTGSIVAEFSNSLSGIDPRQGDEKSFNISTMALEEIEERCLSLLDTNKVYRDFEAAGMEFGPTMKNLREARISYPTRECIGVVTVPSIADGMPMGYLTPQLIHPTLMESMMHILLLSCNQEDASISPMVTTSISEVWISANLNSGLQSVFRSYGIANRESFNTWKANMTVLDEVSRMEVIVANGVELLTFGSTSVVASESSCSKYYHVEWQLDTDLLTSTEPILGLLPALGHIEIAPPPPYRDYQLVSALYIDEALKVLRAVDTSRFLPHMQRYVAWLEHQSHLITQTTVPFISLRDVEMAKRNDLTTQKLLRCVGKHGARGELLGRIGKNIVPIVQGELSCLELMFSDDQLMSRTYDEGLPGKIRSSLTSYLTILARNETNLKVLEVGAGTGSATGILLEALSPKTELSTISSISQYHFTDISAGFFEKAKERFADWSNLIDYRVLNIEVEPNLQGFELSSYDLVIACHVLHATTDLHQTLANVRSLLKPGGKLLLIENVKPELMCTPLIFGLLPGWWQSIEPYRQWSPLIETTRWNQLLEEVGFSKNHLLFKDTEDEKNHEMCASVSSVISAFPVDKPSEDHEDHVFFICASGLQAESPLAHELQRKMQYKSSCKCEIISLFEVRDRDLKGSTCIALLGLADIDISCLMDTEFDNIQQILCGAGKLLWVSGDSLENPKLVMATGMMRTLRWERDQDDANFITLGFQKPILDAALMAEKIIELHLHVFGGLGSKTRNEEYLFRNGLFWTNRLIAAPSIGNFTNSKLNPKPRIQPYDQDRAIKLGIKEIGRPKAIFFLDDPLHSQSLQMDEVEIKVKASGLNIADAAKILNHAPEESPGSEASGIVTAVGSGVKDIKVGDCVMALKTIKESGPIQTFFRTRVSAVQLMPEGYSFADAASIPLSFCTALLSLVKIAKLQNGEKILIHSASGGVGQAAIQLAKLAGAEIFATVATIERKKLLVSQYGISEDHVFSSKESFFVQGIMSLTKGQGVDVILSSSKAQGLDRSWECIASFGRFIDLSQQEHGSKSSIGLLNRNASYTGLNIWNILAEYPLKIKEVFDMVLDLLKSKSIQPPTPLLAFKISELGDALMKMRQNHLTGKVVVEHQSQDQVLVIPRTAPIYQFPADSSYLLVGGLGGLGRSITRWMFSRGARNFIFFTRSGLSSSMSSELIDELIQGSCKVQHFVCDVAKHDETERAINRCKQSMPPIRGCIQGAMVIQDSIFSNMSLPQFNAAIHPKVQGSINLVETLPKGLDFFIMLSSAASIIGNRGAANYVAANAFLDSYAAHLTSRGFRATSISLGSVLNVGWVAENQERLPIAPTYGYGSISESELHSILEYHINPNRRELDSPSSCLIVAGLRSASDFFSAGLPSPAYMNYPLFTQLRTSVHDATTGQQEAKLEVPIKELLRSASSLEAAASLVSKAIISKLSRIMSMAPEEIDPSRSLTSYGVDSLVAVDFRAWMKKDLGSNIASSDILGGQEIEELSTQVVKLSEFVKLSKVQ